VKYWSLFYKKKKPDKLQQILKWSHLSMKIKTSKLTINYLWNYLDYYKLLKNKMQLYYYENIVQIKICYLKLNNFYNN